MSDPSRPNVLFVVADQHQYRALGTVDGGFHTPNLDRLAAEGVQFTNACCTLPQCSPSRSTLQTGQYPHQTGVFTLSGWGEFELDPGIPSVAGRMRDAGYETMYTGRWDLGVENIVDVGWQYPRNVDVTGTPGEEGARRDRTSVTETDRYFRERDPDRPFFAMVSLNMPHPPFFEVDDFAGHYEAADVSLPDNFEDSLEDRPAFHRERARGISEEFDAEDFREMRYQYRTMVSQVDAWVGELLDGLRREDLYENTVVIFTADHGDMQGSHGLTHKGCLPYEEILRVPLLLRVPGVDGAGHTVEELVSTLSLPATILDAAGQPVPDTFEGESLLPTLRGDESPPDSRVFFEHHYAHWAFHPYRGVRTPDYKYVENLLDDPNELYHLADDPGETENLAGNPEYADVVEELQAAVDEWWAATDGDETAWTTEPPGPGY